MEGNDWDLLAVVRGCGRRRDKAATTELVTDSLLHVSTDEAKMDPLMDASSSRRSGFEELEEFFKPFLSSDTQPQHQQHLQRASLRAAAATVEPTIPVPKPSQRLRKRRAQQKKKVVCQVPADSVSSDVWAWRKYGQKPIKGSPHPRGYYRCSSSKGCLARKQMERSRTDPGTFIITYTADHNHPVPTHRNSLAGSRRHKLPSPTPPPPPPPPPPEPEPERSPNTPLTASTSTEEEEEGMLLVEDMEVIGEEDLLIVGGDDAAAANTSSASLSAVENDGIGFDDRFFAQPWLSSSRSSNSRNAAAAAGGD